MKEIYLDHCSTTRPTREVISAVEAVQFFNYGNPGSLHKLGLEAERIVERCRETVSQILEVEQDKVFFTGSGTEGNNWGIYNAIEQSHQKGRILSSGIDHPSVIENMKYYASRGYDWGVIPSKGCLHQDDIESNVTKDTVLLVLTHVNSEIGSVNDIGSLAAAARKANPHTYIHVDCVQSFGKLPIHGKAWDVDSISVSAHKIHGPKGVGATYFKDLNKLRSFIRGGGQENGHRAGTQNTSGIAGFKEAATSALEHIEGHLEKVNELRAVFLKKLGKELDFKINGEGPFSPYILNLQVENIRGEILLHLLEKDGIYISTGTACSSKSSQKSHILRGIGLSDKAIDESFRICLSHDLHKNDLSYVAERIGTHTKYLQGVIKG